MIVDGAGSKGLVKRLMEEASRRAKELARTEALKEATVEVGGRKIPVAEAGDVFNRELSSYLRKKNELLIKKDQYMKALDRTEHQIDTGEEFVEVDEKGTPTMKMELTDRETQSIVDQFYRGLFWYLQDYWVTVPGREAVFGTRESPEFSKLYDTMKAISGVRSNPSIQKVIRAGNEARRVLRDVNFSIRKISRGLRRLGVDPQETIKDIAEKYGSTDRRMTSLAEDEKRIKSAVPMEGRFKSGVQLYFLVRYRDQLKAQMESKNAMYDLLRESAATEYKVSVLESIKANSKDETLNNEIDRRIKVMREDAERLVAKNADTAGEDIGKIVGQSMKTTSDVETLREAIEKSPDEEKKPEPKEASYRDRQGFDPNIFYGKVMQDMIASLAARHIRKLAKSQEK